jgi:CSLREA domain-containing protein
MERLRRAVEMKLFHPSSFAPVCAVAALLLTPSSARAATITVTSTADGAGANDGVCTLREAIIAANTNTASGAAAGECVAGTAGLDTITFAIAGAGVKTITPVAPLPAITEAVFINGYSQSGSSPNTNAFPAAFNTVLLIEVDLVNAGVWQINASGSTIRGLTIHGSTDTLRITASSVTIAGNFIGTNPAGTAGFFSNGVGITTISGDNNIVGGPAAADRNLVSGYRGGSIEIGSGTGNLVQGNYIGTNVTGTLSLQDFSGTPVGVTGDPLTLNLAVLGNLISGNASGISSNGAAAVIQGNLIGTQPDGVSALGNLNSGVIVFGNGNAVGGTSAGQGNTIAFSQEEGIRVQPGNVGGSILGNSIFSSTRLGINLSGVSGNVPLANDSCDVDTLPGNQGQNYPVLTSAPIAAGNVTISGTLNSTASTTFRVEFFSNVVAHASGNGEGRTFIGFANVTTNASCNATFGPLVFAVPPGQTIFSATATDPANNTSEFSVAFPVGAPPTPTPTATPTVTPTSTPTSPGSTPTPTLAPTVTPSPGGAGPASVPTLAPGLMTLFGVALAAAGLLLLRRSS